MTTITRTELTQALHKNLNFLPVDCKSVVDDIFELMIQGMKQDGKMQITKFGTFNVTHKTKRVGRNPMIPNSKTYVVSERNSVKFKMCPLLKTEIDQKIKQQFTE